jgi:excisionase family DNA binding protein
VAEVPKLLTVMEAAAACRVSRTTIYEQFAAGTLPSVHIGARRLVRADDLAAFIAASSTAGAEHVAAS